MKRIDSVNARPDENGIGKAGFNDNADLPGQDATYVSPEWFNTVQEELCNLLELRGITLDPVSKRQLYDLLTTQIDLEDLADEIETNFIRKNQIIDNLTTNDATKVASARTVKELQDNKLDKSDLNNTLTSTSTTQAATAAVVKILNDTKLEKIFARDTPLNVTSSRAPNVTYTNPSSKYYLQVCISGYRSGTGLVDFILNGEKFGSIGNSSAVSLTTSITVLVPPLGEYRINNQLTGMYWSEM